MVKEVQQTVYQCEKCGRRALHKSDLTTHEKNCGVGVKVKIGDKIIVNNGYRLWEVREVVNITGDTVVARILGGTYQSELQKGGAGRIYDPEVWKKIATLKNDADALEKQSEKNSSEAQNLYLSLPLIWG